MLILLDFVECIFYENVYTEIFKIAQRIIYQNYIERREKVMTITCLLQYFNL